MTSEEFQEKLTSIQQLKCETQMLELKAAETACPKRLYDTLSGFSNQDEGGVIIFGIDESNDYAEVGVYDAQDLQMRINEQCLQMEPVVRPLITVVERCGKAFVAAEIPGMDLSERPCYYRGRGRLKGSYTRIGTSDEPMTEYEIYSYEAYRKKYRDDVRPIHRASLALFRKDLLARYIQRIKEGKPNVSVMQDEDIYELMSITREGNVTLTASMLFSPYPQAYFPQLCVIAVVIPGTEMGETQKTGERFLDNARIEGNIMEQLKGALEFVQRNMRTKTVIRTDTGAREDRTDYPLVAVREAILNALVHRDYSIHTEGMPIRLLMFEDRLEVHSPGGIYGRIGVDQLGKMQPDTRNPVLAGALELLKVTENRYSGIPTIRMEMERYGLPEPEFVDERGRFIVKFYKAAGQEVSTTTVDVPARETPGEAALLEFCKTPRSRQELCEFLGLSSMTYAIRRHVLPLVAQEKIMMTIPEKPRSAKQRYYST